MKKKVIILNYGLHISGVSRSLVNFANFLVKNGYEVSIKLEINDLTLAQELAQNVRCSLFINEPKLFGHRIRGFLRFYEIVKKLIFKLPAFLQYWIFVRGKYDVEIAYNRGAAARIISASTNTKAIKLAWVHSDYMKNSNPLAGFSRLSEASNAYKKFNYVVCVSEQARNSFIKKFGNSSNAVTLYNIIDELNIYKKAKSELISKNKFTIIAVGRISKEKNYRLLLDATFMIKQQGIDFDLWIIGDGAQRLELEKYAKENSMNYITFWGEKKNPYPYFTVADLYVSSSIYEGLSTTTIEALMLGKPIIVTECAGMREILGNNQWGIIVPLDTNALACEIKKMICDKKYREEFAKKSLIRSKYFSSEESFRKIEKLL